MYSYGYNFRLPPAQSPGFSTRSKSGIFDLILEKIPSFRSDTNYAQP